MMTWRDIPLFPHISYTIDVAWRFLEGTLQEYLESGLNMDPDFQRGHVWTRSQQALYIEFMLKAPASGKDIYFNHPSWMDSSCFKEDEFVLVDGKQRIQAVRAFLNDEFPAYGHLYSQYGGNIPTDYRLTFHFAKLQTKAEVLKWYLDFNSGGTPHSQEELARVQNLLNNLK
jgi:hypothetical protein